MVTDDWTVPEVVRALQAVEREVRSLGQRITSQTVGRDVYDLQHTDLLNRINKVEAEREQDKSWKRTVTLTLAVALITMLGSLSGLISLAATTH